MIYSLVRWHRQDSWCAKLMPLIPSVLGRKRAKCPLRLFYGFKDVLWVRIKLPSYHLSSCFECWTPTAPKEAGKSALGTVEPSGSRAWLMEHFTGGGHGWLCRPSSEGTPPLSFHHAFPAVVGKISLKLRAKIFPSPYIDSMWD